MSNLPRLTYNNINIDFDRHLNALALRDEQNRIVAVSLGGISETLSFFTRQKIKIGKLRLSRSLEPQIAQFWEYAKTGQTFSFRFDRNLMGYWTFEGSATNNDDIAATFARTGVANYTNPATGLVTNVAANIARYESGKFGLALLMESAMSQICLRTEEFDNAAWTATNITVAADTTETLAPSGAATAEKCTLSAATGTLVQDLSGAADIDTSDGIFTVYAKWSNGSAAPGGIKLRIKRADTGAVLAEDSNYQTVYPQVWTRFSIAWNNTGAIAAKWRLEIEFNTNAAVYYVWGANFEAGRRYPTSYLAATSAATSRGAETISYAASTLFDNDPYVATVMFWWSPLWTNSNWEGAGTLMLLERIGTTSPAVEIWCSATTLFVDVYGKGGAVLANASYALSSITFGSWIHLAVTWDTSIDNGVLLYINGAFVDASTNSEFAVARRGTNLYIGSSGAAAQAANSLIDDLEIRNEVLSASEIANRYNMAKALGWRRNYWSSLLIDQDEYDPRLLVGSWRHDIELNFVEQLS